MTTEIFLALLRNQDSQEDECKLTIQDSIIVFTLVRIDHALTTALWHVDLCDDQKRASLPIFSASFKQVILNHKEIINHWLTDDLF